MTLLPKVKLKVVPTFPSNIIGGTGIDVTRHNGAVTVDMDWNEFDLQGSLPTSPTNNVLTFDTATDSYVMIPSHLLGGASAGIAEAPIDGNRYGRQSAAWTQLSGFVSVKDFNAAGNGTTPDDTAFANAAALGRTVFVPPGNYRLSNSATWNNPKWIFDGGAQITVSAGQTITIRGEVDAGGFQIFSGSGTVTGIGEVWPEWWGATGTGAAHDDAPAIKAAQASLKAAGSSSMGKRIVWFRPVSYGLGSTVVITPDPTQKVFWRGAGSATGGTQFLALSSFTGSAAIQVAGIGLGVDFELNGFSVAPQTAGVGASTGILVGGSGTSAWLIGDRHCSFIFDVCVFDFTNCWLQQDARNIVYQNSSGWASNLVNCTPLLMNNSAPSGSFTGDTTFIACQFVTNSSSTTANTVNLSSAGAASSIAGVRFIGTFFAIGGIQLNATTSGSIVDIWITGGCQLDGIVGTGVVIGAGSSGTINNIHITDSYFYGLNAGTHNTTLTVFTVSATAKNIFIDGNIFYGVATTAVVSFNTVTSFNLTNNKFFNTTNTGAALVNVSGCSQFNISNNQASSGVFAYFAQLTSGQDYYVIRGNLTGGFATAGTAQNANILISGAGAHSTVDGNW